MTTFNFRSLLLAAIVLSNCITWTASRHHYAHNVHQHRTRHRRQGAGLYLPASYVIPGGEGGGPWGEWGEVSPCSRTCGGGVASQKRICLQPGPEGQCSGGDTKYFSCQTQDCPEGSGDFRAEQCAEFNDKAFRGFKYNWVPYTKAPNPCELNCMPHGERFYFRHKLQVTDGTRCNDESFDVCVNGLCQPVGCDMMLNSTAREDKCRECRGNGANCRTTDGIFDSQELMKGYTDILLIPAGSTSIYIAEVEPSNNYLALRAKNGTYYLNGHYHIDFPRSIMIAGALWTYERSQQGFAAPDKLRCLGPTTEPLYLSLLLQDVNVGIRYEYSVPNNSAPPTDKQYNWVHEEFTPCSATCGGGFQTRNVTCRSREELEIVDASLCDEGLKPPTNQSCSPDPCPAQWVEGPWGECSQRCGSGGVKSREVTCQKIIANGIKSVVPDKECFDLLGPKPEVFQKCNEDAPCPTWFVGHWRPCDQLCDEGKQTRQVVCHQKKNGRVEVLNDGNCTEAKPEEEKPCLLQPCDGVDWVTSGWSGCDSCTSKNRTRLVVCSTKGRQVLDDSLCSYHNRPKDYEECNKDELPACEVQWYATQWSKCSVKCGDGVQTRKVFCGMYYNAKSGEGVEVVEDDKCANLTKYKDTKPCTVPKEECPSQWLAGPWTACTETCGGGEQYRRVMCFRGDKESGDCDGTTVLDSTQLCNTGPCDSDDLLPVSRTSTVVMDDKEEYCDDEDYEEVGLDVTSDGMMSDSPGGYAEHESTLETGSGYGSSLSTADDLITEGSGFSTTDTTDSDYTTDNDTGSGETSLTTDGPSSPASKDKYVTTTTTVIPPESSATNDTEATLSSNSTGSTESIAIENTESTLTADTGSTSSDISSTSSNETAETEASGPTTVGEESTESNVTKEIGSTSESGSTSSGETGSSDTDSTDLTTAANTESTTSEETESTLTAETGSTSSDTGSTSSNETSETEASGPTTVGEIGSTESNVTKEIGSTSESGSTSSGETGSSDTDSTDLTTAANTESTTSEETESTPTAETGSTSSDTGSTSSNETSETEASGPTTVGEIGSTESNVTKEIGSTSESGSTSSGETGSSDTDSTGLTTAANTESTTSEETESTPTADTGSTSSDTGSTSSNETAETETSGPTTVGEIGSTESNVTKEIGSTSESGSTSSGETGSSDTDGTGLTTVAETGSTESSLSTEDEERSTSETSSTSSEETVSTDTSDTISTDTEQTESTDSSGSTNATETGSTGETVSTSSGETTPTSETGSTDTDKTESTVSGSTDETGSTESTVTDTTESTVANDTDSTETETTNTGSTDTEETSSTGTDDLTSIGSTDSTTTTRVVPTDSTTTTRAVPTETTESSTNSSESATETSTSSGVESSTGSESTSEAAESSTTSGSDRTAESSSTISAELTTESTESSNLGTETSTPSETESTTAAIESSSSATESTVAESSTPSETESTTAAIDSSSSATESSVAESSTPSGTESTEETEKSSSSVGSESTTESGSSTEESSTVSGEITTGTESTEESTTSSDSSTGSLSTGSEESTISTYSTTEGTTIFGSTEESGSTPTELSTTEGSTGTTTWTKSTVFMPTQRVCKPRWKPKCNETTFGCCPDQKRPASGPFDEGCNKPHTCKDSTHGCCPDGLSPAQGKNNEGCPVEPCADTLFGCCSSDNTTAAQGNDQDGCPPPPPPCVSSKYGCCADNDTEAAGPEKEGCPETETSTTGAPTDTTIETTESNETSEGSTTSEGTTDVISTTTLDPCSGFEFGCCADNETEASGPDGQGCPCNATEFGCCPDGVLPASGLENEGCQGPCSTTPHGCCQDDKTPAHGPDFEGCCLLQAFGCCPDNRNPAEGPHFEGCKCQNAPHGCCPDNVTIAQGTDNQGCGCQYTQHGCCPDRHTVATGPNNEGCACNTYQFGCCADGVTTAKGPEQQGCHCRESSFGCCGDGETHATGPDAAGCDCSSSRHGCCPDGRTEATGPKFLGCTDAPKNKQAACSMSTDPGPCHNFTAMWYYDLAYGGCSRFWYGGCDGNGNRFVTKEECEDICVQPSPKDACKLPSVKGACDADYQRWHYNSTREQCIPFRYGGCLGNANNFDTRELCQKQCEPSSVAGQCNLPIDQGSCAGNYSRWGFNSEAHRCEQFIWGGCEGNSNRFSSEAACQMRCAGTQPPQCTQPLEAGNCTEKEALWSFSQSENRCLPFHYSGCGGNDNQFRSRATCEQTCPSAYVPDKCTLPAETGQCSNYREKWFYDTTFKRCRQFYYGGCGGNENKFDTEAECENSCSEIKTTTTATITTTTTTARPVEPQPQPRPVEPAQRPVAPERSEFCFNAIDAGPCTNTETRYAYDSELGRCVTFQYGGCGGNQNNFPDEAYCSYYCQPMQDICQLPMLQGPCEDSLMRWFYDPTSDSCSQFTYGGCEGNDNRFESLEACENRCRTGPAPVEPTTPTTTVIVDGPSECRVPKALEDCHYGGEVWYFDPSRHECVSHANQEAGPVCRYTGTFLSQEACERSCGAFRGVDVCKQRKDPGPCQSYVTKAYFDPATGQCHEFIYGGCLGGANRFSSIEECSQVCKAEIADPCTLPPEGGNCFSYVQQWYYDPSRDQCNQFVYTGCSGNENRFETQRDCEARCRRPALTTTTVATPPQQRSEEECRTPSSLAPCGNNVTVFYYDSERRQCLISGFGGCGHPNTYRTEEECERTCGAFRGMDVCGAHLDPGPCRASFNKIYWDAMTGSCQPYAYGGCDGGPNRFSNVEECMSICGDTGPARECLQAVDTGHSCGAVPAPRYHYSVAHVDCVVFAYLGCGGNDNNFRTYADCADVCRVSRTRGNDPNGVPMQDCTPYRRECEALADCHYGIDRFTQDGCQRCQCKEDPCIRANCKSNERCVAIASRNSATQEPVYSARCVAETNEVYDCDEYVANCSRLRCEYGIQRTRLPDGCDKCSCVQIEIDCEPLKQQCDQLKCDYGIERVMGNDGCERCKCKEYPCERKSCGAGERCVVHPYMNGLDPEPKFTAECRIIVKAGACPMDETTTNEVKCRHECSDDADCRGVGKCCRRGCSDICLVPVEQTSPHPLLTTAAAPNMPAPPQALPLQEPEVSASEGGTATLRCLFHGNPPPKITWKFGELTIDGNAGRYRLMSDGALEIVSLYRNDTGVYICVADNGLGVAIQEVHLAVNDPVRIPVGIAGDENAVVIGELGRPLHVRCLAYGYPQPSVFWYRGYESVMVPYNDAVYEARGNVLLIRSLALETLGQYTCQAYNGEGKAASWVVFVRAYMPEGLYIENELLVPRNMVVPRPRTQRPTTAETTTTTTSTTTEAPRPMFTVPVSTHVSWPSPTLNIGADLHLTCEVDGFPEPDVHWTKDGNTIQTDDRITITGSTIVSRLTVMRVTVTDSGLYACHARNPYSSQSDTAQINVQQLVVPAKCTDNPFFANCDLIVRSKFCRHKYYSKFCCKSCVEAGQLDPQEAELQADQPLRKK